ncbi:sugar ABC transporter permease [Marispirochaeta sp.]|uniref:carbohydrate ABC transporter permease n=1 Tax=Marispirochaeta sp. TaxID=2038653 RepID=UPI0029C995F6|nr:sugar ABC transporter permease [Marispirochaeta sp.]
MIIDGNERASLINRKNERTIALLMIAPTIISFVIFLYIPFVQALQTSVYKYNGLGPLQNFVGMKNYIKVFNDPKFFHSLYDTFFLMGAGVLAVPIGFILAYVLFLGVPGGKIFSSMLFIPYLISMVVVGCIWRIIYDPAIGPLNQLLKAAGMGGLARAWLSRPESALGAIAVTWIWRSAPFNMLIIYANISKMPDDFIEAADIDGANTLQKLIDIIIPYLKPTFATLFILSVTNALRLFDLVWVMTKGGPGGASDVVTSYIYTKAFTNMDFGLGTAASVVLMAIMVSIMVIFSLGKKLISARDTQ